MSIDVSQLRDYVIRPAISSLGLGGDNATYLLLLTCAQETGCGHYLVQRKINFAGGIGIYQMEAVSYHMIWQDMVENNPNMKAKIKLYCGYEGKPAVARLATDLSLATIMARLYYRRIPAPLPNCNMVKDMAAYWKKYWNTEAGKGTVEEAIANYEHYIVHQKDH